MKNIQPKKSSRLFILLGAVLTILSMIGVYAISSGSSKSAGNGTTPILVASRVIPSRTVFASASDVAQWMTTVNVPVSSAPPQYFTSVQAFVKTELATGKVYNSVTLIPKEEALSSMFTNLGTRPGYTGALTLPKNDVAVSLSATIVDESGGAITPGDYVDILASYLPSGGGSGGGATEQLHMGNIPSQTQMVLQNIKVIAVGPFLPGGTQNSVAASGSTMLTFQCDRHTAMIIQHLKDFGASWNYSIFLRSAYASNTFNTSPVDGTIFFHGLHNNFER